MMAVERDAGRSAAAPLLQAVNATTAVIQRRARIYRWAVGGALVAVVVPLLLALILLSWRPLPYIVALVPVVGALLVIDSRTVLAWQQRVLRMWLAGDFGLSELRRMIESMRYLPAGTVKGMFERLPASEPLHQIDQLPAPGKASFAERCLERDRRQDRRTLLSATGATLLACSVAVAVSIESTAPLLVGLAGLVLIVSSRRVS
jgi:fatty acid desaturase